MECSRTTRTGPRVLVIKVVTGTPVKPTDTKGTVKVPWIGDTEALGLLAPLIVLRKPDPGCVKIGIVNVLVPEVE